MDNVRNASVILPGCSNYAYLSIKTVEFKDMHENGQTRKHIDELHGHCISISKYDTQFRNKWFSLSFVQTTYANAVNSFIKKYNLS